MISKKILFPLLISALVLSLLINLSFGTINIPFTEVLYFIFGKESENPNWQLILMDFRLPKMLTAALAGCALGVSGLQMQTLFQNPLAGPYILGISAGASLGVAVYIFFGTMLQNFIPMEMLQNHWLVIICACLGSFLVFGLIVLLGIKIKQTTTFLILGLMVSTFSSSVISILQYFSQAENIKAYVFWGMGSLTNLSWLQLKIFIPVILLALLFSFTLSKPLNALLLGENYAVSVGLHLKKIRWFIIINTSILAGTVTAFCGPIAFFGIAMPHLARLIFNTTNHLFLIPIVILISSILMLLFDTISQLPGYEYTLPINIISSLLGAPFIIYFLIKKQNLN